MKAEFNFGTFIFRPFISKLLLKFLFRIPEWKTDYNTALAEAKKNKKVVFALFSDTVYCYYCKYLHIEVLTSGLFYSWADKKVVLWKADLNLAAKYNVLGIPTAIGLNSDGTERGRSVGYSPGTGPKSWLIQFETNAKMNQSPGP